ncbi:MAG: hypothetical protein ETSY1_01000 [Candidatus Entotheonella factor]|uniref:Sulfatase-modifying factor enzyme-like domain-containing protein n=1 Tax=Entotheonella factor TaxID=1429438 RepID=W4LYJ4_ENTF1|nr:MAG: hypothetical protein ETSY1_01000 [Candidatus Entotheonella factor]
MPPPFPLAPFLAALDTDGIAVTLHDYDRISLALRAEGGWTVIRLRRVLMALLVCDDEQEAVFLRRFDAFFDAQLDADAVFPQLDVERALADLRRLAQEPVADREVTRPPRRVVRALEAAVPPHAKRFRVVLALVLAVGLGCAVGGYWWWTRPVEPEPPPVVADDSLGTQAKTVAPDPSWPKTLVDTLPVVPPDDYKRMLLTAAGLLLLTLAYGFYLWRSRQLPRDKAPEWQPDLPRHFRLGAVGGAMAPRLDAMALDQLADALGYFQSEQPSDRLDVAASIEATGRNGGLPRLVFRPRHVIRTVLVLEDIGVETRAWNAIARELAEGLRRRGVPVIYGTFTGVPQQFRTPDGTAVHLDDLDDNRQGYLLLVFSDGKGVQPRRDALALEALARWPMVAWMELRDRLFWDENAALPTRYGIPLYAATPEGLAQAMGRFVSERGQSRGAATEGQAGRGLPVYAGVHLDVYLEEMLSDALSWAQACAMVQPLSFGMADALRRAFCGALPPQRIDRLIAMPGTARTEAGLSFATPVLSVLRQGFAERWEAEWQEEVLRFVLERIEEVEPPEPTSWAHLTWEWMRERVRLEVEPDAALERLSGLAQTRLGGTIRAALDACVLPGRAEPGGDTVPLRLAPRTRDGLQRLARLAVRSGVPLLEAYPVAWWHRVALGLLVVACLGCAAWGGVRYRAAMVVTPPEITFVLIPAGTFLMGTPADQVDAVVNRYELKREWVEDETPQHEVEISQPFYLGEMEVTQAQWQAVMGSNPSWFKGHERPVEQVSWEEVQEFIRRLNTREGREIYRLPTEAEWEYAARAGTTGDFSFGSDPSELKDYAWYGENSGGETHPVRQKKPNDWGLYDMSGNVWEWVQDWYGDYLADTVVDPQGPNNGANRVVRGGGWRRVAGGCRVAIRGIAPPAIAAAISASAS